MATHQIGTTVDRAYRRITVPLAKRLAGIRGVSPNRVSVLAFVFGGLAATSLVMTGHLRFAALAFIVADILDYLDGDIARAQGTSSLQGDFLDGILDRATDLFLFGALVCTTSGAAGRQVAAPGFLPNVLAGGRFQLVGILAIAGALLPSYVQALAVADRRRSTSSICGRGTRNRLVHLGLLAYQPYTLLILVALMGGATVVHRSYIGFQYSSTATVDRGQDG